MSRRLGEALDAGLLRLLSGAPPAAAGPVRDALLLVTLDGAGRPHPALLSHGEIVALDTRRLRIAVRARSGTATNLRERRSLTLCLAAGGRVAYLKASAEASARAVPGHPALAAFDATVDDVHVDEPDPAEGAVRRTSGFTFEPVDPQQTVRREEALRAALREIP